MDCANRKLDLLFPVKIGRAMGIPITFTQGSTANEYGASHCLSALVPDKFRILLDRMRLVLANELK